MISSSFNPVAHPPSRSGYGYSTLKPGSAPATSNVVSTTITTRVEINGGAHAAPVARTSGVDAYKAVEAVSKVAEPSQTTNPYAQAILSSIQLQLQRDVSDGASQAELQSRLAAGLSGFEEGFDDAYKQLQDSGLLSDDVKAAIQETFTQVQAGIAKMAEEYGVEAPVSKSLFNAENTGIATETEAENPAQSMQSITSISSSITTVSQRFAKSDRDLQTIKNLQSISQKPETYEYLKKPRFGRVEATSVVPASESRDFSFKLKTQDGDIVTVRISNALSAADGSPIALAGGLSSEYQLDINGELDSGELDAISELLSQVGDISEMFYSGDMDQAVSMASNMSFNGDELSGFHLSLGMTSTMHMSDSNGAEQGRRSGFGEHSRFGDADSLPAFESFRQKVRDAAATAERLDQPKSMIPEMLTWVGQNHHKMHPHAHMMGPMARAVI